MVDNKNVTVFEHKKHYGHLGVDFDWFDLASLVKTRQKPPLG